MQEMVTYHDNEKRPNEKLHQRISKEHISFQQSWKQQQMSHVCQLIKQWKVKIFWLQYNEHSQILKELSLISLPNLLQLALTTNKIYSLEGLCRSFMPALKYLSLDFNEICFTSQLKKVYWPFLQELGLEENKISEFNEFSRMESSSLEYLSLESMLDHIEEVADLRGIIKLKSMKFEDLYVKRKKRIQQPVFLSMLRKKYPNMRINEE